VRSDGRLRGVAAGGGGSAAAPAAALAKSEGSRCFNDSRRDGADEGAAVPGVDECMYTASVGAGGDV